MASKIGVSSPDGDTQSRQLGSATTTWGARCPPSSLCPSFTLSQAFTRRASSTFPTYFVSRSFFFSARFFSPQEILERKSSDVPRFLRTVRQCLRSLTQYFTFYRDHFFFIRFEGLPPGNMLVHPRRPRDRRAARFHTYRYVHSRKNRA